MQLHLYSLIVFLSTHLIILVSSSSSSPSSSPATNAVPQCFTGAVYEHIIQGYSPEISALIDVEVAIEAIKLNLQAYNDAAEKASIEGAQIIVFPEDGIHNVAQVKDASRDVVRMVAEAVPEASTSSNPCFDPQYASSTILRTLSCTALENKIYLVATMVDVIKCVHQAACPTDGLFLYNTQVAFDKNGTLVAKYHKQHLFGEHLLDTPEKQELVYFDTDFGARIGMYICFDRVFYDPLVSLVEKYNVTTMALSTWWFDGYPFLLSHQIDQYQSRVFGINILTACAKNLPTGTTGSGLYSPFQTVNVEHDLNIDAGTSYPRLLIGNLPIDPKVNTRCPGDNQKYKMADYALKNGPTYSSEVVTGFASDLSTFQSVLLNGTAATGVKVCSGTFCCTLDYEMKNTTGKEKSRKDFYSKKQQVAQASSIEYHFMAVDALRNFSVPKYSAYEQACLILAKDPITNNASLHSGSKFKSIVMNGSFETPYVFPTAISEYLHLVKNKEVTFDSASNTLTVQSKKPIMMAALYGRVFAKDVDEKSTFVPAAPTPDTPAAGEL